MIRIEIETGNAAFHVQSSDEHNGTPDAGPEAARMLREFADRIDRGRIDCDSPTLGGAYRLIDTNGHAAGKLTVTK